MNEEITLEHLLNGIKKMFSMFFKKWKLILTFTVIGSILGVIYAFYTKPLYIAEMTMLVKENKPTTFNELVVSDLDLKVINNDNLDVFSKSNITELIKSRDIIKKTLSKQINLNGKKITLEEMYRNIYYSKNKKIKFRRTKLQITNNKWRDLRIQDSILNIIYIEIINNLLNINQKENNSQIFKLQMNTINENLSKSFLNNLATIVTEEYLKIKTKNINILKNEIDSIKNEINTLVKFENINLHNSNQSYLKTNVNEFNERILFELLQQLELAKLSLKHNPSMIEILDKPILPLNIKKVSYPYASLIGGLIGGFLIVLLISVRLIINRTSKL